MACSMVLARCWSRMVVVAVSVTCGSAAFAGPREDAERDRDTCLAHQVPLMRTVHTDTLATFESLGTIPVTTLKRCWDLHVPIKTCRQREATVPSIADLQNFEAAAQEMSDRYFNIPAAGARWAAAQKCGKAPRASECPLLSGSIHSVRTTIYVLGDYPDWIRDLEHISSLAIPCGRFDACVWHSVLEGAREDQQRSDDTRCREEYSARIQKIRHDDDRAAEDRAREAQRDQETRRRAALDEARRNADEQRRVQAEREEARSRQDAIDQKLERARQSIAGNSPEQRQLERNLDIAAKMIRDRDARDREDSAERQAEAEREAEREERREEREEAREARNAERARQRAEEEARERAVRYEGLKLLPTASLRLESSVPGIEIAVRNEFGDSGTCVTPCAIADLLPTTYNLTYDNPAYLIVSTTADLKPGEQTSVAVHLTPTPSGVVLTRPTCGVEAGNEHGDPVNVIIDGELADLGQLKHPRGNAPRGAIHLAAGTHQVTFQSRYCESWTQTIAVPAGKAVTEFATVGGGELDLSLGGDIVHHALPAGPVGEFEDARIGIVYEQRSHANVSDEGFNFGFQADYPFHTIAFEAGVVQWTTSGDSTYGLSLMGAVQARVPLKYLVVRAGLGVATRLADDKNSELSVPLSLGVELLPTHRVGVGAELREYLFSTAPTAFALSLRIPL